MLKPVLAPFAPSVIVAMSMLMAAQQDVMAQSNGIELSSDWLRFGVLLMGILASAIYLERRLAKLETNHGYVATRETLVRETGNLRSDLKEEIGNLRSDFKEEISNLRTDLTKEITNLRTDLKQEITLQGADLRVALTKELSGLRHDMAPKAHA